MFRVILVSLLMVSTARGACPSLQGRDMELPAGCTVSVPVMAYPLELDAQIRAQLNELKMVESKYELLKKDHDLLNRASSDAETRIQAEKDRSKRDSVKLTSEIANMRQNQLLERVIWVTMIVLIGAGGFALGEAVAN
jgi:hypothetical protein